MMQNDDFDLPVEGVDGNKDDSPIEELDVNTTATYCYLNSKPYRPGARVCWGGNVLICQSSGQWHNSRKKC